MVDWMINLSFTLAGVATAGAGFGWFCHQKQQRKQCVLDEYKSFVDDMSEGFYRSSLEGKQLSANKSLVRMNGYETEEELLAAVEDIASEWYVNPRRREDFSRLLEYNGYVKDFVSEIYRHKTRERIWISENARLVEDRLGRPSYYSGTVREISEAIELQQMKQSFGKFTRHVPGVLFQARWSPDGGMTMPSYSPKLLEMLGDETLTLKDDASILIERLHSADRESVLAAIENSIMTNSLWTGEFRLIGKDKKTIWLEVYASPEEEAEGSWLWHGYMLDVTAKKQAEYKLKRYSLYDPLTDLPNRKMLLDRIKIALDQSRHHKTFGALLVLDLDNFKEINEMRGHAVGDELLQNLARRLASSMGDDGVVARLGGDEFAVLLKDLGDDEQEAIESARNFGERLHKSLIRPYILESGAFQASASVGVRVFGSGDLLPLDILKHADIAHNFMKNDGRNGIRFFNDEMRQAGNGSNALMTDLQAAIGTDQLNLHYQMLVDGNGSISGAEALLRWTHPESGPISPADFIPLAEKTGMIVPVTDWVLEEAFQTLARWQQDDILKSVRLSINIGARQFEDQGFVTQIERLIRKYKIDAHKLVLEMTEHVLTGDVRQVEKVMLDLKKHGVGFSLDDFGTGYSSLMNLRDLPFDEVKIDGKFVAGLENNPDDRAIIKSVIGMAKALGMETVAEWVETDAQCRILVREGCDTLQGHLFAPSLPLDRFEAAALMPVAATQLRSTKPEPLMKEAMVIPRRVING